MPQLLQRVVGRRRSKARLAQEGKVPQIAATLLRGGPDTIVSAAQVLGSLAQYATPSTLLALLRAHVPCILLFSLHKVRCMGRANKSVVVALFRTLRTLLIAVASHIGASVRWGIGSGWGTTAMAGLGTISNEYQILPLASRRRFDWSAAGPSAADAQAALGAGFGVDDDATQMSSPEEELFAWCRCTINILYEHMDDLLWAFCEPAYCDAIQEPVASILSVCLPIAGRSAWDVSRDATDERNDRIVYLLAYRSSMGLRPVSLLLPTELATAPTGSIEVALWALEAMLACAPSQMRNLCAVPLPSELKVLDALICLAVHRSPAVRLAAYACLLRLPPPLCPTAYMPDTLIGRLLDMAEESDMLGVPALLLLTRVLQSVPALSQHLDSRFDGGERLVQCVKQGLSRLFAPPLNEEGWHDNELLVRWCEGSLYALAACCAGPDKVSERLMEKHASFVPDVLRPALVSAPAGVQAGAARLVCSMSRSVRMLRTTLHDAKILVTLMPLLHSHQEIVQLEALCALGNMAVKQSPSREYVFETTCLGHLAELSRSTEPPVQTQALCVLKNALGGATLAQSETILTRLSPTFVCSLLVSPDAALQEQGMGLVRNLTALSAPDAPTDFLAKLGHDTVLDAMNQVLQSYPPVPVLEQTVFALANVAASGPAIGDHVAARPSLLATLALLLQHSHVAVREAVVLCGLNLLQGAMSPTMAEKLESSGYVAQLRVVARSDAQADLRCRAQEVLALL